MVREIKNWSLRQMLDNAGYNKVRLYKDHDLFFIDDDLVDGLCERLNQSASMYAISSS